MGQTDTVKFRDGYADVTEDGVRWAVVLTCPYCGEEIIFAEDVVGRKWSDVFLCDGCGNTVAIGETSYTWVVDERQ